EEQLHALPRRRCDPVPARRLLRRRFAHPLRPGHAHHHLLLRGGFSTVPAYLKDLFGVYQVGAIHGALLTAWSAAGVAGPLIVNSVVEAGEAAGKSGPALYTPGMFIMVGALVIGLI